MGLKWVLFFVAFIGSHIAIGFPLRSTQPSYPVASRASTIHEEWSSAGGLYTVLPALGLLIAAVGLVFGCTWCYRHKDCKIFAASAPHLHELRRNVAPDSGFSEPAVNNNAAEDNNNGPISLRELQNIANNNAAAYIASDNEQRNRSRESVVEFEPLPTGIRVADPLEHCADWFDEDFQRNKLQYLREIGRGWFGRVVEGEIEVEGGTSTVAVKILNQNASLEDKARFLDEAKIYRDMRHENVLAFITKCLEEDPWVLIFELCSMDLQQYLVANRPKMAILNESGVPLQLMCDVASGLSYLHSQQFVYGNLWTGNVLVRARAESVRAVVGQYAASEPPHDYQAPEFARPPTVQSDVWSLGTLVWEICAWGTSPPHRHPPPPDLPCPYRNHLYQVMQLCWNPNPEVRPTSAQVYALINHLYVTHSQSSDTPQDDGYGSSDFEERWQRLKPNTIPKIDEHIAIVHAPSTSMASHFTESEQEFSHIHTVQDSLSVDYPAVSRSSSIMSDKDPLSVQIKSESLTNLHGSLEDVRNIYLTHNETAVLECHQANIIDDRDNERDRSDNSVDPWLKDIMAGSQDDVSYYKDVSDVIKNLDNILNSEKTSSSESSHQASPSRDNLSLECKREPPLPSNMVKSPGIINFQNVLDMGFQEQPQEGACDDEVDRDTIGTLSHSFERHSDTNSQNTLENLTPVTPVKDDELISTTEDCLNKEISDKTINKSVQWDVQLPKENKVKNSDISIPTLKELCLTLMPTSSVSLTKTVCERLKQTNVLEDCQISCDLKEIVKVDNKQSETKSIDYSFNNIVEPRINLGTIENLSKNDDQTIKDFSLSKNFEELDSKNDSFLSNSKTTCTELHDKVLLDEDKAIVNADFGNNKTKETKEYIENAFSSESQKECNNITDILDTQSFKLFLDKSDNNNSFMGSIPDLIPELSKSASNTCINETIRNSVGKNEILKDVIEPVKNHLDTNNETTRAYVIHTPELVQNTEDININKFISNEKATKTELILTSNDNSVTSKISAPEIIQNIVKNEELDCSSEHENIFKEDEIRRYNLNDSTIYMDLVNDKKTDILKHESPEDNVKESIKSCLELTGTEDACYLFNNDSTIYLTLPKVIKDTDYFLHTERLLSSKQLKAAETFCASTPRGSDISADNTFDNNIKDPEKTLSETIVPNNGQGLTLTNLEQKYALENVSPMESPTKSHHTDTFDENSSVVLGPFENCTLDLFKGVKCNTEELLAFSSNFSEIDLETPSPLRDGNFLNEVPDILHDDGHFDDIETISEVKIEDETNTQSENNSDKTDVKSITEKHVSPLTPPNSPGDFLTTTSQQKYIVNTDLIAPNEQVPKTNSQSACHSSMLQNENILNQNELQITAKLAIAENENNMNMEYSGPLTVEVLATKETQESQDEKVVQETYLAGNGSAEDDSCKGFSLDAESMKALRDELEIKLPLAQVAAIEPQFENDTWSGDLPPPPELIVSYPGALSPIVEETGQQLTAYENDINWNLSIRTDSSESYPEPCNNSTDDVTDLPTGVQSDLRDNSTYTIHTKENSLNNTYTIHKDVPSSKALTMSDDSLNAKPLKKDQDENETLNKNCDEKESLCERISQVSPYLVSPTTDTSAPMNSENIDNVTGVSSLSKTSQPTDGKVTKASDTQCLSKATSIDSWCSNDTLYNVEENFDDLVMDTDVLVEDIRNNDGNSESSNTLTHHGMNDQKDSSDIMHESQSEHCETFSPDSITANDNGTYTKIKTETCDITPFATKSDINDSTKNSQTKDLAYGSLISGLPSCSNYTTEIISGMEEIWKLPQPELIRRSPVANEIDFTLTKLHKEPMQMKEDSPKLAARILLKKMDSVEISCLQNASLDSRDKSVNFITSPEATQVQESPKEGIPNDNWNYHYKNMANSISSTPLTEQIADTEDIKGIPMLLPQQKNNVIDKVTNFENFLYSAELRPQDLSGNTNVETQTNIETSEEDKNAQTNIGNSQSTASYIHFENSVLGKPQGTESIYISSSDNENSINIRDQIKEITDFVPNYAEFENSATSKHQNSLQNIVTNPKDTSPEIGNQNSLQNIVTNPKETSPEIGNSSSRLMGDTDLLFDNKESLHSGTMQPLELMNETELNRHRRPEVVTKNKDLVVFSDSITNCLAFGKSSVDKPQDLLQECEITANKHINVIVDSEMVVSDLISNYSDFENSATNKPQNSFQKSEMSREELTKAFDSKTSLITNDLVGNNSDFENSTITKPQVSMQDSKSIKKCTEVVVDDGRNQLIVSDFTDNYSDFEISATKKPQDSSEKSQMSPQELTEAIVNSSTKLDIASISSANYSDFEISATNKPQDLINTSEIGPKEFVKASVNDSSNNFVVSDSVANYLLVQSSATNELSNKSEIIPTQSTDTVTDSHILVGSDSSKPTERSGMCTNIFVDVPANNISKLVIGYNAIANYSDFENSAVNKPQDLSEKCEANSKELNKVVVDNSTNLVVVSNTMPDYVCFDNSTKDKSDQSLHHYQTSLKQRSEFAIDDSSNVMVVSDSLSNYSDFEKSATKKPQDLEPESSESYGSNSENFKQFELSAKNRSQDLLLVGDSDLSKIIVFEQKNNRNEEHNSEDNQVNFNHSETHLCDFEISTSSQNIESDRQNLEIGASSFNESNMIKINNEQTSLIENNSNIGIKNIEALNVHKIGSKESQNAKNQEGVINSHVTVYNSEDETEQPHSFIVTEKSNDSIKEKCNDTYDSHGEQYYVDINHSYDSHSHRLQKEDNINKKTEGVEESIVDETEQGCGSKAWTKSEPLEKKDTSDMYFQKLNMHPSNEITCNGDNGPEKFATVNILNETFEELMESNVDDNDTKGVQSDHKKSNRDIFFTEDLKSTDSGDLNKPSKKQCQEKELHKKSWKGVEEKVAANSTLDAKKMTSVTEFFLWNEKKFCQLDYYIPVLNDIRFTGPATEIMSTSFTQESPTEPTPPEDETQGQSNTAADILKDWDSDTDSHSTNSSSGEFIWKQREGGAPDGEVGDRGGVGSTSGDSGSGSGSEGDEVEFVPSSWDCRAAPSKSSLRSLEQVPPESKKRVVFKRQKYHCVYEYPREIADVECDTYIPDFSTYAEWEPAGTEEAELGYGQLFAAPSPLDLYPLRAGVALDYDEDFFISSSARPFESLGLMSTSSQFFPGMHLKSALIDRDVPDDVGDDVTDHVPTWTPSLDFTTPDSGVEDITPSTTTDEDYQKKLPESECWKPIDSASSSESVSPSSPGGETLGGLRHTRDKLKLDLPPSPHIPSPRHNRVFNFVLDKPKRKSQEEQPSIGTTPLVMTDETPIITTTLSLHNCDELTMPEPTFSTFGKSLNKSEQKSGIILTDEVNSEAEESSDSKVNVIEDAKVIEAVKGEGTVLDSGDEDSGIESSSKATLERKTTPNVS